MCKVAHQRSKYTKKHQIIKVESPNVVTSTDLGKKEASKCPKHSNQDVHFYCNTCEMLTCGICAVIDHRSSEHKFSEISDAIKSYRGDVDDVLQQFQKSKEEFKAADESVDHARSRLKIMIARTYSDISAKEEAEIAKIRNKSRLLKEKVTQIGKERDEKFETVKTKNQNKIEQAENVVERVTELMQQADDFELLTLKPKVMHNLEFQKELKYEHAEYAMSFIGVTCFDIVLDKDLGKILYEEKWQLKREFGEEGEGDEQFSFAKSVGCFSNGDISVVDTEHERVSLFTSSGEYKTTFAQDGEDLHKLSDPRGNAVTYDDFQLITDGENVKVFNANQELIRYFKPILDDAQGQPKSSLGCIAVDRNKRVAVTAVTDDGRNVLVVRRLGGSFISVIPVPSGITPEDIAISNTERIIFTDYRSCRLISVDFTGNTVFDVSTFSNGQLVQPSGVCCDEAGDIYVAVELDTDSAGSDEIHHYDPLGVYIRCIVKNLYHVLGMTFSPGGEIVVADQSSIKILHRA